MSGMYHAYSNIVSYYLYGSRTKQTLEIGLLASPNQNLHEHANVFRIHVTQTLRSAYKQAFKSVNKSYVRKVYLDPSSYIYIIWGAVGSGGQIEK